MDQHSQVQTVPIIWKKYSIVCPNIFNFVTLCFKMFKMTLHALTGLFIRPLLRVVCVCVWGGLCW